MNFIDTHSHLFLEAFSEDLPLVIERAKKNGVSHVFMPNIDSSTIQPMLKLATDYQDYCYPMIGLHPTSVTHDYQQELEGMKMLLKQDHPFIAIGEVGVDLYWDKSFLKEQLEAFEKQIQWAIEYHLPLVVHSRDSFDEVYNLIFSYKNSSLKGVFHSFTGTHEEAAKLLQLDGFKLGINGVVTFKNATLAETLKTVPLGKIILETDSPYLTPVPNRGKRNESANIIDTLVSIARIYNLPPEEIARITTTTALALFDKAERF